ncbi:MAG: transposase [Chromatiaceae bacterium]|nr:MAG: transposase [Chromatiaceae bacterium]
MSNYRRIYIPGGCYFFTLVTAQRRPLLASPEHICLLREAFRKVREERPFAIDAIVVMPDHLHCVLRLPAGDADYSGRWREIKKRFSRALGVPSDARRERPVWQRRFWEHTIRDEDDWRRYLDYIHYNPVKHGRVRQVCEWPYSSFRRAVAQGLYPPDWGLAEPSNVAALDLEWGE